MIERTFENIEKSLIDDISVPGFINLDFKDCELAPGKLIALVRIHSDEGMTPLTTALKDEWEKLGVKDIKSIIYQLRTKRFCGRDNIITMESGILHALGLNQSDCTIEMGLILDDSLAEDEISMSLYVKA